MTVAPACGPGCTVGAPGICCNMDHSYQETVDEMMECGGLEGLIEEARPMEESVQHRGRLAAR